MIALVEAWNRTIGAAGEDPWRRKAIDDHMALTARAGQEAGARIAADHRTHKATPAPPVTHPAPGGTGAPNPPSTQT